MATKKRAFVRNKKLEAKFLFFEILDKNIVLKKIDRARFPLTVMRLHLKKTYFFTLR